MKRIIIAVGEPAALVSQLVFGSPKLPERKELSEEAHHQLFDAVQAAVNEVAEGQHASFVTIFALGRKEH